MTPAFAAAGKKLLAGEPDGAISPKQMAARAAQVCEQISQHLARLVGETGIRMLLVRSMAVTSSRYPWLANTIPRTAPTDSPWTSLKTALEQQDPHVASEAFVVFLSSFVELLERLIGEGLVACLLHEVWPEVFRATPYKERT